MIKYYLIVIESSEKNKLKNKTTKTIDLEAIFMSTQNPSREQLKLKSSLVFF